MTPMPRFAYKAYDGKGRLEEGALDADSEKAVLEALARRGRFPLEVALSALPGATSAVPAAGAPVPWWQREIGASGPLPLAAQAVLARELATLLAARLPVDEALRIVALQPRIGRRARRIVADAARRVGEGAALSDALAAAGRAVPDHVCRLVAAGERSGRLPEVLGELAQSMEQGVRLAGRITTALLYPCLLLVASLATLGLVVGVMVPAVVPLFRDAGVSPPAALAFLAAAQETVAARWPLVLGLVAGAAGLLAWAATDTRLGSLRDGLVLRLPFAGPLARHTATARLARSLAMLLGNGVPMVEALTAASGTVANGAVRAGVREAARAVNTGAALSGELARSGLLPDLALRFVRIGEETGQLVPMLARVADLYEHDVEQRLERGLGIAAPLVTIVIGLGIGALILSVMSAVLGLNEAVLR